MSLKQWTVGGRGFGSLLVFILMAGEIYTTFTFLGASGFAYQKGGVSLYIIAYICLAFVSSYWLLPPVWRIAKERGLLTQPDYFESQYESRAVGLVVALVGLTALVPYLILQFKGLGIIVETASNGAIPTGWAICLGAAAMTAYVVVSGVHGSAWTAAIKDAAILLVCAFLGLYLPYHYYGGIGPMFAAIEAARPGFLALPSSGQGPIWYLTTIMVSALGVYLWPHTFGSIFTSKTEGNFRKNAVIMPLYALVMLFSMLVGFAASLQIDGLSGGAVDLALLRLTVATFDPWFVGIVGAAGALTALVSGSMMLISASALVANNVVRHLKPGIDDRPLAGVAKAAAPAITILSVVLTLGAGDSIVGLIIIGYGLVTQLVPSLLASLGRRRVMTAEGAIAGIAVGVAIVIWSRLGPVSLLGPPPIAEINPGVAALAANLIVALLVSALAQKPISGTVSG